MKKLLLIDGNAILHRAYHALPPLTNSKGEIVNVVYGFFSMLVNVLQDQKPDYLVVCFDRPKPTIRQSMYAGYHAHRQELPEDFVPQIGMVHEMLEKMKVAVFELDGYEADDLIGTIATQAIAHTEVVILTGDRDLLQLVNKHVKVLMPITGITKTALFDEAKVEEKYGVHPRQFIDYKALIGDPSDGYPGVTGIGPKTASSLLQKYDTFENLYEQVGKLPEKIGLKLATDAEQAALAKKLATIITDVPIQFSIDKCACSDFDKKGIREAFVAHGFKTLTARWDTFFGVDEKEESKAKEQLELL
jgi:DNA polymerase-1